ncbi:MAG TPA: HNH endonuclease signature motif containing protein [Actinomycetota bacterium]|nr:HNH endonuclease signature motif containing protein [Actinomycetota bacterium]
MRSRRYTDAQLAAALARSRTMRELLAALGLVPRGGNYETVRRRIAELGLDASHLRTLRRGRALSDRSDAEIAEAVRGSRSLAEAMRRLGLRPGGNQARLKQRIQELGIDTSHLLGQGWSRGVRVPYPPRARPLAELLVEGTLRKTSHLKRRLIAEGVKPPRCERCGLERWNEGPIPLELDHINGRRDDNRLENLRLLCPNCHAQTPTYRGRNIATPSRPPYDSVGPGAGTGETEGP